MPKGYKHSEEARRKISEARRRRKEELGYINSPETRRRISESQRGREQSPDSVAKRAGALRGRKPKNFDEFQKAAWEADHPRGPDSPNWKGDDVGYSALHAWLRREMGTPTRCEKCGTDKVGRYEWHNISGEYRRDTEDYIGLCVSCHRKLGYENGEYKSWNKGLSVQCNTGRTHIKPGQHLSPKTQFKKGQKPHNKYLEPKLCMNCGESFQPREASRKYCCRECYWESLRR